MTWKSRSLNCHRVTILRHYCSIWIAALLCLVCPAVSLADDNTLSNWPQWRGPLGTGAIDEADPPAEWSNTKNIRWKTPIAGRGHSSPIVWEDFVFLTSAERIGPNLEPRPSGRPGAHDNLPVDSEFQFVVYALDRRTGQVVWKKVVHQQIPIEGGHITASLASASEGVLYLGSSYEKRALMAIRLDGATGDITDTDRVLWRRSRGTPYVPSPLLYGETLYYLTHYQNNMTRIDGKTGTDDPGAMRLGMLGNIYASPVGAGGRVYVTDLDGVTLVLSHSEIPRIMAVNRLREKVSASAAIAGREIFLRGDKHLFCISESK